MSHSPEANSRDRAEQLIGQMLDRSLTDQEHRELLEILERDERACEYYLEQSMLHALLRERSEATLDRPLSSKLFGVRPEELSQLVTLTSAGPDQDTSSLATDACDFGDCMVDDADPDERRQPEQQADPAAPPAPLGDDQTDELGRSDTGSIWDRWWKPGSFGALFSLPLLLAIWFGLGGGSDKTDPPVPLAQTQGGNSSDPSDDLAPRSAYVARIVKASTDCVWGELAAPAEFLLRVRAGDPMHVAAGLVEMEFYSGARVILHGPAVFTPTGPASGRLESGRLTGEVTNGDFRLMTPTAEVIDLGTSFGVVADADVGTDVVVFDGRVQVVSMRDGVGKGESLDMTEGMAARFRSDGTTEYGLKTDATQFARRIATSAGERNPDEICLVDVLAGGNGLGAHLAGAIDPQTGQRDFGEEGRKSRHFARWTDGAFHAATWHPLIDGVFIPWSEGRSVQIDTRGGKIDTPHCTGTTHGSIWARRKESIHETDTGPDIDFWGTRTVKGIVERLKNVETGLVGMHSNVGITIDLRMLRMVHRRAPIEFRTSVANIENSADWAPHERPTPEVRTLTADCRVYVDGQLRASHLGFDRNDGGLPIHAALHDDDRFLTILVTDGDGEMRFDHVVLIDPTIALKKE